MEGDDKFADKYRIDSTRLLGWDYGDDGYYFITICTKDRECYFGDVVDEKMILNDIGRIVEQELLKTVEIRKNVRIDTYQIMPNHAHTIFVIDNDVDNCRDALNASRKNKICVGTIRDARSAIVERDARSASLQEYRNSFGPQRNNLSSIVRGFKSSVQSRVKKEFGLKHIWQSRFYDHIIRTEKSLNKIRYYIITNTQKWEHDRNNPANLWM